MVSIVRSRFKIGDPVSGVESGLRGIAADMPGPISWSSRACPFSFIGLKIERVRRSESMEAA